MFKNTTIRLNTLNTVSEINSKLDRGEDKKKLKT